MVTSETRCIAYDTLLQQSTSFAWVRWGTMCGYGHWAGEGSGWDGDGGEWMGMGWGWGRDSRDEMGIMLINVSLFVHYACSRCSTLSHDDAA